jgi:hypothetical protein
MNDKIRKWHLLVGLFFAPSLITFAVTGTLQTFQFHEAHDDYVPPAVISAMAAVHKEQTVELEAFAPPAHDARPPRKHPAQKIVLLKWFVLFMALGLIASQITGVIMALRYKRDRKQMIAALLLGTVIPTVMAFLH